MDRPAKPLLVYDGDCDFCRAWIERWRRATGDRVDYASYQEVVGRFPRVPVDEFKQAVQLFEPDGRRTSGAEAVFRSLASSPGQAWMLALYQYVPPFAWASDLVYRLVASHRPFFLRLTRWIWGAHLVPPGETLTIWIFLRLLAVIYGIAFVSLWVQIIGLAGHGGVMPAADFLSSVANRYGAIRFWYAAMLCWLGAGNLSLHLLCGLGVAFSVVLLLGFVPIAALFALFALYLSLATVCQDFLWFQWDSLLLEAGVLSLLLAPWRWRSTPATDPPPARGALFLARWLLFRVMFSSAVVKLTSGDPSWRHLTALQFHYETQCLPPWTAWYAHHLAPNMQRFSAIGMFAIEGLVPFLIIAPRRIRFAAGAAMVALQVLILVTGNYGFFNWLAIVLCVPLLDDGAWPRAFRERLAPTGGAPRRGSWNRWVMGTAVGLLVVLSLVPFAGIFRRPAPWLGPIAPLYSLFAPWRIVSSYGLFAVMTTRRPEIIVEGSMDGATWLPYEFRYKPGDLKRKPRFVAPHQPRLDWQMWFAALSDYRRENWFLYFCQRLLEGSRPVLAQLESNPFPRAPPRYLRATLYDYHFTDAATRRATGAWWRRERLGLYCPVLMLEGGRLVAAPIAE